METTAAVKYGGRKKGTPNRLTKEVRSVLKDLVFEEISHVKSHLKKLDSRDRIELLIKLLPYVCPKVEKVSHNLDEPIDFSF